MPKLIDLKGQRFGRLVVLERQGSYASKNDPYSQAPLWLCRCDCGNETVVIGRNLRTGRTRSCGCLRVEKSKERALRRLKNVG